MPKLNRSALIACALTALFVANAGAQERGMRQLTRANAVAVSQTGQGNAAGAAQNGQGNTAGIRQIGANNTGTIQQDGNNNSACLIQLGRNLDGAIIQTGDFNNMGVLQTRNGARAIDANRCQQPQRRGPFRAVIAQALSRQ